MSAVTCEEKATPPDSLKRPCPQGCAAFSPRPRCSSVTDRCEYASSSRPGETKNRLQRGMAEYFNRLLGINAVIDSPEQIVHFARADFGFRIFQRYSAIETVLRMFQPGSRLVDVAKNIRRVFKQSRKPHDLVGFIRRQAAVRFAPLQCGSRDGKFCCELLKRHVDTVLQRFQLGERQSLLNPANQFVRMLR